jgi:RNA polymerase sigma-70 factor (ECF subfamily)
MGAIGASVKGVEADDGELLRRTARGDEAAFDELWRRHAPWLLLRLRRRAPEEAGDLLQETFLAAWRNAASFRGADAGGWLWRIASRRLIDASRRATVRGPRRRPAPIGVITGSAASAEEDVLAQMMDAELAAALDRLSPELRVALQMTVVDGLSTREAAAVLGVAEGTVKSRTSRARALLRHHLATLTDATHLPVENT